MKVFLVTQLSDESDIIDTRIFSTGEGAQRFVIKSIKETLNDLIGTDVDKEKLSYLEEEILSFIEDEDFEGVTDSWYEFTKEWFTIAEKPIED